MDAVIFDLDNTLTHRGYTIRKYADAFCHNFKGQLINNVNHAWLVDCLIESDENGYAGHDKRSAIIRELGIWNIKPTIEVLTDHWVSWFPYNPVPMPGLYETLNILKGKEFKLGIITNGGVTAQTAKINVLNIGEFFECITISEQSGIKKPNSEIFYITANKLQVHNKSAFFIGDHPTLDYLGSMEAGLVPIWFSGFHEWPSTMKAPRYVAGSLLEVTDLIIQLNKQSNKSGFAKC